MTSIEKGFRFRFVVLSIIILSVFMCVAFSAVSFAATVSTSNATGSLRAWDVQVDWFMVDWDFSFNTGSGAVGDTISITTNNVNLLSPRNVTTSSGDVIGVLEYVGGATDYPNSWNDRRNYQIRLTKDISSASVTLQGSTSEGYNRFIYDGGHRETCWISVNGVTAASGPVDMITCKWGQTDYYASIVSGLPWAYYENGAISTFGLPALTHSSDHGAQLQVGDTVTWHLDTNYLHLSMYNGHTIGEEIEGGWGYNPSRVPSTVTRLEPYGFLETRNWVSWKYKVLYCNDNEVSIQITQVGTGGIEWDISPAVKVTLLPQNGSTIDFSNQKTRDVDYTVIIRRNGNQIHRTDGDYCVLIQSQEELSEASFYAQVITSVENGTISPSQRAEQGANFTVTYAPNSGYLLHAVVVDGTYVNIASCMDSYTLYGALGTHTVHVVYSRPTAGKTWAKT